jgi:hypothetical protein
MIPGALIKLGGTDYTVPPINLRIDFAFKEQIATVCQPEGAVEFAEYVDAAGTILFALFQRNYPDMSRDAFNELIDLPLLRPVMNGMLQMSGYTARPLAVAATETANPSPAPESSDTSTETPDGSPTTSSNA